MNTIEQDTYRETIGKENKSKHKWYRTYGPDWGLGPIPNDPEDPWGRRSPPPGDTTYHVPGYAGYVPREKFSLGQTFGRITKSVYGKNTGKQPAFEFKVSTEQVYEGEMPPQQKFRLPEMDHHPAGYSGYIPGQPFHFGGSYGDLTRRQNENSKSTTQRLKEGKVVRSSHHPPGYGGHVPYVNYSIAETYGKSTRRSLYNIKQYKKGGSWTTRY